VVLVFDRECIYFTVFVLTLKFLNSPEIYLEFL
jgi:hypothetical protein